MARFFFHLTDGTKVCDPDGEECSSLERARDHAIRTAHELARNKRPSLLSGLCVCVTDESGSEVFRVPLAEAKIERRLRS